jgi:dTDP-4-amino-4,6-dideoxygalactose transaminase
MMIFVERQSEVVSRLNDQGVHASPLWFEERACQVARSFHFIQKILDEHIVLPIHQDLTPSHMARLAAAVGKAVSA